MQGLTQVEEMLISRVLPIMSVYRLPHGQYGYSGHVINLPQDVASFATSLPRLPSQLDVIVVRRDGTAGSHRDFKVRRSVVLRALQWLLANNIYYRHVHIDQAALSLLPADGDLTDLVSVTIESSPSEEEQHTTEGEDPYNAHLSRTFIPNTVQRLTEQETVRQSIQDRQHDRSSSSTTVPWPPTGTNPINEFTTEGYISGAFPTLFPTGAADFIAPRSRTVTIGNYYKHLMMYEDDRFARHPRFRYFALNTEMRWRALQTGRIYVRQHPHDAHLSVQELRDMVGRPGEAFSNRVLHYAATLRGTRQYWFRQRSRLIAMVDTLGLPTIFFTHSAADLQWPELAKLICPDDADSRSARNIALQENPAIADWFFYHRIQKFAKAYYVDILGASDYWLRFEWQHRGSPHVHGLAWLKDAPDVRRIEDPQESGAQQDIINYVDKLVSTTNPAVLPNGSNVGDAPAPKTDPHICHQAYSNIDDLDQDLADLVATCQRHTRCSAAYCLRTRGGTQQCRFGFPKPLQPDTALVTEEGEPVILTQRNDGLTNSYNPIQLSSWRANVDMQYCVSRHKVIEYCAKYATKSEPRSQTLKEVYTAIVRSLSEDSTPLKAVQKLLINSVGERDYSAQETCHLLLQLPMFETSRQFVVVSLDGSRSVEELFQDGQRATAPSYLDHYINRPSTSTFEDITILHFAQKYTISRNAQVQPSRRRKDAVVVIRPFCSPDPNGPHYEQYCRQKLMQYIPFLRQQEQLLGESESYAAAYAIFLQSGNAPPCLADDIHRLEQESHQVQQENESTAEPEVGIFRFVHNYLETCSVSFFPISGIIINTVKICFIRS